jgi:Ricin-type beta-trefoil lectin domain-like
MGNFFFIQNSIGNVIDIEGASNKHGALLDARPAKSTDNESQLWEFVADPAGSGYFFIKNKNGNVIDIKKASFKSGAPLDAFPQKAAGTVQRSDNQLWLFMDDPWGSGFFFIVSKLNGNVIDIEGAAVSKSGARLDAFPLKGARWRDIRACHFEAACGYE